MFSSHTLNTYVEKIRRIKKFQGIAPYKPFLLLAVIQLIEQGDISKNKIAPTDNLIATFKKYIDLTSRWKQRIYHPFYRLKNDSFWHLRANPRCENELENPNNVSSVKKLCKLVAYAYLDEPLFYLLTECESREIIRQAIVDMHVPKYKYEIENLFIDEKRIVDYEEVLIKNVAESDFSYEIAPELPEREDPTRSAAFRQQIMRLYDYTCAVCKLRIVKKDGRSATDAAHIIPFHLSYNDDIRNGISLCKLHHWAFDEGLISLNEDYEVMVSSSLPDRDPTDVFIIETRGDPIKLPEQRECYPAQDALEWHRDKTFEK